MGAVSKARDPRLHRIVAVKILPTTTPDTAAQSLTRLVWRRPPAGVQGNQIVEGWFVDDSLGLLRQLGVTLSPIQK